MRSSREHAREEWTLDELAQAAGVCPRGNVSKTVRRVASLKDATSDAVAVFYDERYRGILRKTNAGIVILTESDAADFAGNCLIAQNPRATFARIAEHLNQAQNHSAGIHPKALVSDQAFVAPTATVLPFAIVESDARIGENVIIGCGAHIGKRTVIGESSRIDSNVVIYRNCVVGRDCTISANAVIGGSGFSYANEDGRWVKIPNIGNVVIGDRVDIGAATTVDRSTMGSTRIGDGVKIDNNVQIAHNVSIGEDTILAGNVGIAGSVKIGRRCKFGGQASVLDHLEVCDDVTLFAGAMVTKSINAPGEYSATLPAQPADIWRKTLARLRQLADRA